MNPEGLGDLADQFPFVQQAFSQLCLLWTELPGTPKPYALLFRRHPPGRRPFPDQIPFELGDPREQVSGPITSLQYFRGPIEEVAHTQVGADYYRYLEFRLKPLEAQWLKTQSRPACANFAQAEGESRETK